MDRATLYVVTVIELSVALAQVPFILELSVLSPWCNLVTFGFCLWAVGYMHGMSRRRDD